ncbi:MAG: amidohydrolase [Bacteroidales bacterium]|nr:amidohydrolase [Bacteroidales bacterium]
MQNLKTVIVQADIAWEDIDENLFNFDNKLKQIDGAPDLIVLPEMFNTGFTMNVEKCAENENGKTVSWLKKKAEDKNCIITGSLLVNEAGKFYNRMFWVNPDGSYETYDKRHLFRMGLEHHTMSQGSNKKIVQIYNWKINLQVCYDLRFPVWSKNNYSNDQYDYDILLYIANWPEVRNFAYKSLLIARAIENQSFVIWVNRVGYDGNQVYHSGDSMVIDPAGKILAMANPGANEVLSVELNHLQLNEFRKKFKVGLDWDKFDVNA